VTEDEKILPGYGGGLAASEHATEEAR